MSNNMMVRKTLIPLALWVLDLLAYIASGRARNHLLHTMVSATLILFTGSFVHAGYEQPAYIDGCQSTDGRFVITAEQTLRGKTVHGPHKWEFIWKDTNSDCFRFVVC